MKKIIWMALFAIITQNIYSQNQTTWQNAFYKSYDLEKSSNYTGAISELKKIYKTGDYFVNIRLGWLYYLAKNYQESSKYYLTAIKLKPYAIEARFGYVKPLSALESWENVKAQYLEILKIDSHNTIAGYWLGLIYYNRKEFSNAAKQFEKIVNLYPLDYDSVIMLAWTKLQQGKSSEAKLLFNHALTLRPNDNSALSGLKSIK